MPRQTKHPPAPDATPATEGMTFAIGGYRGRRQTWTVKPKCAENSGQWVCTTHEETFDNQLQKDLHIREPGPHVLAWNCWSHGPEVP